MLKKFKLPLVIVVIVLLNQAVTYAVQAAVPTALLPGGTTRYTVAQATGMISTSSNLVWAETGLSKAISIPVGKTADVIVLFCANTVSSSYMQAQVLVGTSVAAPGLVQLRNHGDVGGESQCANFYAVAVPAGIRTVKVQWKGYDTQTQWMYERSMIVIVNFR